LIGLSSYGKVYARLLMEQGALHDARLAGIVDPYAEKNPYWPALRDQSVPRYDQLAEFLARHPADLAVIASPTYLHCPQTCAALQAGLPVLCEKPVAGSIQDGRRMLAAREAAGRFAAIGYNWSFCEGIQALKRDVIAGLFGRPVRLKTLVLWPRPQTYYQRNNWAGKLRMPDGAWVLDSPVNNATAHYLHNMFYILGAATDTSAMPAEVTAELYRANAIENYDTACLRAGTLEGAELLFVTSHASDRQAAVHCEFVFEQAVVKYEEHALFQAVFNNGRIKEYAMPDEGQHSAKLWQCLDAVRRNGRPVCGLEAALAQTICMNGAQDSMPEIVSFPPAMRARRLDEKGAEYVMAPGLTEALQVCYESWRLPSECGLAWARAGRRVDLKNYAWYPGGQKPSKS